SSLHDALPISTITTKEMREKPDMIEKVQNINAIRAEKSIELMAKGEEALYPYDFHFLLLCNKICGKSHYNMQINIIVETQEEFNAWIQEQQTFKESLK